MHRHEPRLTEPAPGRQVFEHGQGLRWCLLLGLVSAWSALLLWWGGPAEGWGRWLAQLLIAVPWALFGLACVAKAGYALVGLVLSLMSLKAPRPAAETRGEPARHSTGPSVSVLVPAYNEEKVILKTVQSLLATDYGRLLEVLVIDDGSTDGTARIVESAFHAVPTVRLVRQRNAGKAAALNRGIAQARGQIVLAIDADTVVMPPAIGWMVNHFEDPAVHAVSGNMHVGNAVPGAGHLIKLQAIEYLRANNLERRGYGLLNCITVIPGAIGAYRADVLRHLGGYHGDTLAEDFDLTVRILASGGRVTYEPQAVVLTEAPETLKAFARQRFRWCYGKLQVLWKYRRLMLRPSAGTLGCFALPSVALSQNLLPLFAWMLEALPVCLGVHWGVAYLLHGDGAQAARAWEVFEPALLCYAALSAFTYLSWLYALFLETGVDRRLTWSFGLSRWVLRGVLTWISLKAVLVALRGGRRGWDKLERSGSVPALKRAAANEVGALT